MSGITDVRGVLVGHAHDETALTGCTVVLTPDGAVAGVDVRGSSPGTRETDLMRPCNLVQKIQAVVLSGGSAYGLDAASGVMQFLEEQGRGFNTEFGIVPIVAGAVIYDLGIGDPRIRPDRAMGYEACRNASDDESREGNVGAGMGATVGKMMGPAHALKGGLGTCSAPLPADRARWAAAPRVGAIVAVNSLGDVVSPRTGRVVAGAYDCASGQFIGPGARPDTLRNDVCDAGAAAPFSANTTIAVVATDAMLDKEGANKVAQMAHDGLARAIVPIHTMYDGDVVFCLSTGHAQLSDDRAADITRIGSLAAQVLSEAVIRAVRAASGAGGYPSASDIVPACPDH